MFEMLDHNGPGHFGSSFALGFSEPNFAKKNEGNHFRTNPEQAMASSATSATSFELIEDQALTAEEVEMASQEAQEVRTREAAVAAGLVLDEPEAPPSASATDVMNDLSSALERLRVAFSTPTPGLGASGPAEDEDKEMSDAVTTERATPPTKRLKGFPADHGPGAGGWPSWLFQASGPPRPLPGPSGIGGHVAEGRHGGGGGLPVPQVCR